MAERVVTAPDGRRWRVHRRWLPRHARWLGVGFVNARRPKPGDRLVEPAWLQGIGTFDADLSGLAVVVAVVAALILAWFFVFPALFFVLDLLLVLLLAAGGVALRVLFRRPWVVEAVATGRDPISRGWAVVGWRASGDAVDVVAAAIVAGREPLIPRRAGEPAPPV